MVQTQTEAGSTPNTASQRVQAATSEAARLVEEALKKWIRRSFLVCAAGLLLFVGFIIAAVYFNASKNAVNRNGQEVTGEVKEIIDKSGQRIIKVAYSRDKVQTSEFVIMPPNSKSYVVGQPVSLSVDRDIKGRTIIIGANKAERVTSMPVAGLLVSSLLVMGIGIFDLQAAWRCRKHLQGNSWRALQWRGVVYGPGRGRVRAAGWLADDQADRQYLMVNAIGCWRQGIDLLAEPTQVSVAGNPVGIVVVRHPATLRVVLLRPPRGERQRARALNLLAGAAE